MAKKISKSEKIDKLVNDLILELTISEGRRISLLKEDQKQTEVSNLEVKILQFDIRRQSLHD